MPFILHAYHANNESMKLWALDHYATKTDKITMNASLIAQNNVQVEQQHLEDCLCLP